MGKCLRHFTALTRKNFINYIRTPGCSLFELIVPALLFVGLSLIRNAVPTIPIDQTDILGDKLPVTVGIGKIGNNWCNDTECDDYVDLKVRPFYEYLDWATYDDPNPANYHVSYDAKGG